MIDNDVSNFNNATDEKQEHKNENLSLVLGMAFVTEKYALNLPTASRDRYRLLQLESLGFDVISCAFAPGVDVCEPGKHISGYFSARCVRSQFKKTFSFPFSNVFLDYFRFPSVYLVQAYTPFFKEMLEELIKCNLVDCKTKIYVPNKTELLEGIKNKNNFEVIEPIKASQYPLCVATKQLSKEQLGGYNNKQELKQLDAENPFLIFQIKE
jgi:hypothetical protein